MTNEYIKEKIKLKHFFSVLLFVCFFQTLFSQGLIINEVTNGSAGTQEYYELVVIGSSTNPLASVDLGGWIVDDNNGSFEGSTTTGIAQGHIRIKPGSLSSVKPGSIILIYNSSELVFTPDPTDANSDCVYIIPINDVSLDNNSTIPSTTNSNYSPAIYGALQSWTRIGLRNDGDAVQVRKPDGTFYHGFSYGDVLTPFPTFPTELGGLSSFNVITGSGTSRNYFFNCGNPTISSNFTRGTAPTNETPGLPNNDFNRFFINSLRTGTYNYSNLSSSSNCGSSTTLQPCDFILNIEILNFDITVSNSYNRLNWSVDKIESLSYFELERSSNGYDFEVLEKIYPSFDNSYFYDDYTFESENYYRLKITEIDDAVTYSNLIFTKNNSNDDFIIYPNPNSGKFSIKNKNDINQIKIYNSLGQFMFEIQNSDTIDLSLEPGWYYLSINGIFQKLIIQ